MNRRVPGDVPVGVPQPAGAGPTRGGRRQGVVHAARRGGGAVGPHLRLGSLLAGADSTNDRFAHFFHSQNYNMKQL